MAEWDSRKSLDLYNVEGWGAGFFGVGDDGNMYVRPDQKSDYKIDLKALADDIQRKGYSLPALIRFSDILKSSIAQLSGAFDTAIKEHQYQGVYRGVYPIKVNQQRQVVEEIVKFGRPYHFGLEAGSKPELQAILAIMDNPEALLICNGYKDETFIRLALMGQKLGKRVFIVVERLAELTTIIDVAEKMNLSPNIGLRIKLVSAGSGRWAASGGEHSKFGLSAMELVEALNVAKERDHLDCVRLMHFHLGSQITNIHKIKKSLQEIGRYYSEMIRMGCPVEYIDVGGGLGVDYDGSRSTAASSTNYSVQEYANDVVYHLSEICEQEDLPHPNIISESGRALTAHHSMLIFNVLDVSSFPEWNSAIEIEEDMASLVHEMHYVLEKVTGESVSEAWHDAQDLKEQAQTQFQMGLISLEDKALVDRIFWGICKKIEKLGLDLKNLPDELTSLKQTLADKYFCNFSVFQSAPDSWAIEQVFPIIPLQRLNEKPTRNATLMDLTCDSDGAVDGFIGDNGVVPTLPVHELNTNEPYRIGIFLTGAYQEILGDLHNLFGDTNAFHVSLNADGNWQYEQIIEGENVTDVLDYVQFRADELAGRIAGFLIQGVHSKALSQEEADQFFKFYKESLNGYTYLIKPENLENIEGQGGQAFSI